jgi:hypothetical protein
VLQEQATKKGVHFLHFPTFIALGTNVLSLKYLRYHCPEWNALSDSENPPKQLFIATIYIKQNVIRKSRTNKQNSRFKANLFYIMLCYVEKLIRYILN